MGPPLVFNWHRLERAWVVRHPPFVVFDAVYTMAITFDIPFCPPSFRSPADSLQSIRHGAYTFDGSRGIYLKKKLRPRPVIKLDDARYACEAGLQKSIIFIGITAVKTKSRGCVLKLSLYEFITNDESCPPSSFQIPRPRVFPHSETTVMVNLKPLTSTKFVEFGSHPPSTITDPGSIIIQPSPTNSEIGRNYFRFRSININGVLDELARSRNSSGPDFQARHAHSINGYIFFADCCIHSTALVTKDSRRPGPHETIPALKPLYHSNSRNLRADPDHYLIGKIFYSWRITRKSNQGLQTHVPSLLHLLL
ncbi:uncharacterized protein BDR25DRAFT_353063 [Lindgomyces ingoldianus]|uniref:Uncharacterized protein n=1 Tax=Lindgomyces ingoldianus TaxID=673940 RepID=A0ACB6R0G5_9PLEO|nr:uncharacterized protein BDR25DRAFT_353063 [Lindgomyces ingoldianus]KAF2472739.1 hypothetical protein BDR25DRAFT_353063 [Lindgomyces ingoldianus]